jgi:hypothetical protein
MPNIFDEANRATEELFAQEGQPEAVEETPAEAPVEEAQPSEVPAEATPAPEIVTPEQAVLDEATQTAEIAAQAAAERDSQLQQALQEIEEVKRQNERLQGAVQELSQQNEQHIIEEALEPPVLDISSLAFADEDTIKAAQAKYAQDMAAYNRQDFMKEFAPVIEQANKAKYAEERNETLSILSQVPELRGIENMVPQLDRIIANNRALSSSDIPLDEKYITAYAIAMGVNTMNTPPAQPKELTTDELMALYNNNSDFQEMVERQRIEQVKNSQQVPPFSASSGAVNAALDIKEEPKGWDDASERTRKMFGLG